MILLKDRFLLCAGQVEGGLRFHRLDVSKIAGAFTIFIYPGFNPSS
ncbi:MAG: hypothetical protein L6277_10820 [Desulfobacterales bacterium]|nr:hypothetical protein [Desulfobacterales bacterium]